MGRYIVVTPCAVGDLHYAQVPAEPIEVDDALAAPLVESGALAPFGDPAPQADADEAGDPEPAPQRRRATKG